MLHQHQTHAAQICYNFLRIFHGCYCLYCPSSDEIAEADNGKLRIRFQNHIQHLFGC